MRAATYHTSGPLFFSRIRKRGRCCPPSPEHPTDNRDSRATDLCERPVVGRRGMKFDVGVEVIPSRPGQHPNKCLNTYHCPLKHDFAGQAPPQGTDCSTRACDAYAPAKTACAVLHTWRRGWPSMARRAPAPPCRPLAAAAHHPPPPPQSCTEQSTGHMQSLLLEMHARECSHQHGHLHQGCSSLAAE